VTLDKKDHMDLCATKAAFNMVFNSYELTLDGEIISVNENVFKKRLAIKLKS